MKVKSKAPLPRSSTGTAARASRAERSAGSDRVQPGVLLDRLWRLFASQYLALILILLLAAASLAGVVLVQAPPSALSSPESYGQWVEQIRSKYGAATGAFRATGLFHVFSTWWFRSLMALLALNILVCTLDRAGRVLRGAIGARRVVMPENFFQKASLHQSVEAEGLAVDEAAAKARRALRWSGYRVLVKEEQDTVHLFAEKHRFAPAGTLVHHLSLVVLLLGFVVGAAWGMDNSGFVVPEGTTRAIGNTGLALHLETFVDEYYPEGPPKDYRSRVTLYDDGRPVREAVVRVNEPLVYDGVRVHQSFFGPAAVLQVHGPAGELRSEEVVPLKSRAQDRPIGSFVLPDERMQVYVVGPASSFVDPVIQAGQVRLEVYRFGQNQPLALENVTQGRSRRIGDLTYTFVRERQFSGFRIVQNPGSPLLWAGAIGIFIGLIWVLYFRHRQLWARCRQDPDGTVTVAFGAAHGKGGAFAGDFGRVVDRVAGSLRKETGKVEVK